MCAPTLTRKGKSVKVGNASTEWGGQAADNRAERVGTRERAKQSQQKMEIGPQAADIAPGDHKNASALRHCLGAYRTQKKGST